MPRLHHVHHRAHHAGVGSAEGAHVVVGADGRGDGAQVIVHGPPDLVIRHVHGDAAWAQRDARIIGLDREVQDDLYAMLWRLFRDLGGERQVGQHRDRHRPSDGLDLLRRFDAVAGIVEDDRDPMASGFAGRACRLGWQNDGAQPRRFGIVLGWHRRWYRGGGRRPMSLGRSGLADRWCGLLDPRCQARSLRLGWLLHARLRHM